MIRSPSDTKHARGENGHYIRFFDCEFMDDDKDLSDVGKVQIDFRLGGDPDFADFDPAVARRIVNVIMDYPLVLNMLRDVLEIRTELFFTAKQICPHVG